VNHSDPDILALLALGEDAGEPSDHAHLAACPDCRVELDNLRRAATVGRSTLDAGELLTPDPKVWAAITAELGRDAADARPSAGPPPAPVTPLRPRSRFAPLVAVAAAVALVAGGGITWWALSPKPQTVLASATLDAFPDWADAAGAATVHEGPDGARVVEVTLSAPTSADTYREVWLISSDATQLVSLGVLRGDEGSFTIPDGLDLGYFDLVDISQEPLDGDPAHSGDSIVRGTLSES
jgi:hypothetical protein